ncbi:hypothetical protein C8R44DRAFT_920575 [Mycena epipterygia]|nr:hypothetical protein C8R44DRAFT_920575 [Mycena epipterygia]
MNPILSQLLSFAPVALIPFIPNGILRYISIGIAAFAFAAYFLYQNAPRSRARRLEASVKEVDELFNMIVDECSTDPHFIADIALRLATMLNTKHVTWKKYPFHLQSLVRITRECRQELGDLRSSISLALEARRQEKYMQEISHRITSLRRTVPAAEILDSI